MMKAYIIEFKKIGNLEIGNLIAVEETKEIPFTIKRSFWTYNIPNGITRGHHAHYVTEQVLICMRGRIVVEIIDRNGDKIHFELNGPNQGLYLPPDAWHTMTYFDDAIQLVMASEFYDENDYIRDFNNFK